MEKSFKLLPPLMPNFLPYENGSKREHVSVSSLNLKEAIEYGDLMKNAFIDHWKKKKMTNS